jgi:hypothetical protein
VKVFWVCMASYCAGFLSWAAIVFGSVALFGCAQQPIKVPVYKRAAPPAELSEWQPGRLPTWIGPIDEKALAAIVSDPELFNAIIKLIEATSCLTPQGEQEIRDLLVDMKTRIRAWEAWVREGE